MVWAAGCVGEETFPTPNGAVLQFSVDTLRMDTVIADVGTPTAQLTVYNRNNKGVSITDVSYLGGNDQGFRTVVDGVYINEGLAAPIDLRANDSLRVLVELTPQAFDDDEPVEIETSLCFTLANGTSQRVVLSAFSQNVEVLRGVCITSDTILAGARPYLVYNNLKVAEGITLRLAAGTVLYFHSDVGLEVEGTLLAEGTGSKPVVFRGDRTDKMFEGQPYDRIPDQWQGLHFAKNSYGNRLEYCDIHSGHDGVVCDSSDISVTKLRLENSIVHNMGGDCVRLYHVKAWVGNCQLSNAANHCVNIFGGDVEFVHCSLVQFYPFVAFRGVALKYANELNGEAYPLENLRLRNCLVTGYSEDEIEGIPSAKYPEAAFNYSYANCLLNTPEVSDDDAIVACLWDRSGNEVCREKNFPPFNINNLLYDFRPVERSLAVGAADGTVSAAYYPKDLRGVERLADGAADAGCYEFIREE